MVLNNSVITESYFTLLFSISCIVFSIGFYATFKFSQIKYSRRTVENINYIVDKKIYYIFFLIVMLVFFLFLAYLIVFTSNNFIFNLWQTIAINRSLGVYNENIIFMYGRIFCYVFTVFTGVIFYQKSILKYEFIILIAMSFIFALSNSSRGSIIMIICGLIFSLMIVKNFSNKKISLMLIGSALLFLSVIIITSFSKFSFGDQSNRTLFIRNILQTYFGGSMPAFVIDIQQNTELLFGKNTFSFFLRLLNAVGFNFIIPESIQNYVNIDSINTNVYTVLKYYTDDFGIFYALLIMFFLGILYGVFYKKIYTEKRINVSDIVIYSFLFFPLINQFFDDKYFSVLSMWIQVLFWSIFLEKVIIKKLIGEKI